MLPTAPCYSSRGRHHVRRTQVSVGPVELSVWGALSLAIFQVGMRMVSLERAPMLGQGSNSTRAPERLVRSL